MRKFRNTCLEREVKHLQEEIELINSYRNGSVNTTGNTELINMTLTQDIVVIENNQRSNFRVSDTNDSISTQQNNNEDVVVIEDDTELSIVKKLTNNYKTYD